MRRWLLTGSLVLMLATALLFGWLFYSESGLRWAYQRALPLLPGELEVQQLSGTLADRITLQGIVFRNDDISLRARQLVLQWNPAALLKAEIDLSSLLIQQLDIDIQPAPAGENPQPVSAGLPSLELPLGLQLRELGIDQFELRYGEQGFRFERINLRSAIDSSRIVIDRFAVRMVDLALDADHRQDVDINLHGEIDARGDYSHRLDIDWHTRLSTGDMFDGSARLSGDLQSTQLALQSSGALQANLALQLENPLQNPQWQASLELADFDTTRLDAGLPVARGSLQLSAEGSLDSARASGQLDMASSEAGEFKARFALRSLDQPQLMNGVNIESLQLDIYEGQLATRGQLYWAPMLSWKGELQASAINPAALFPEWPGKLNARIQSSGQLENDVLELTARIDEGGGRLRDYPFSLQGNLNWREDRLNFEALELGILEGKLSIQGQLFLSPMLRWEAGLQASDVNPAALLPEWPGKLNASIQSSGQLENGVLDVTARIEEASGRLRDYPFSLQSNLHWREDSLEIEFARLNTGTTQISAHGRSGDTLDLEWSLDSQDLAELYPAAGGQLTASGHLGGEPAAPVIEASLQGKALSFEDYSAASIDADVAVDLLNWKQLEIRLSASQLDIQGQQLQSLEINGNQHELDARLVAAQLSAKLGFVGALVDDGWNGKLMTAAIDTTEFADWRLQAPVAISLGKDAVSVASMCLQSSLQSNACGQFRQNQASWQTELELNRFPLKLLKSWTPPDLELEGLIDASANLDFGTDARLLGKLNINLPAGSASYVLQEGMTERFDFQLGELRLLLERDQASVYTHLVLDNGDRLEGSLNMPRADILNFDSERQIIEGNIRADVQNWLVLNRLLPQVENLSGRLESNIDVSGSLAEPRLQGSAMLQGGSFSLRDSGQKIEQVNIDLQSDGSDQLRFEIAAEAAGGSFSIRGMTLLGHELGWATDIEISGADFDIQSLVSPWFEQPLSIDGRLQADARLQFRAPDQLLGEVSLDSAQGQLTYPMMDQANERTEYREAFLSLTLDEKGLVARSGVKLGSSNAMSAQVDLPGARLLALDPQRQEISGKASIKLEELGLIHYLTPDIDKIQGQLELEMTVAGKLADPQLRATASMQQASFEIPRMGLQIRQLSLKGATDDNERFNFEISAQSGEGSLTITGSSNLDPGRGWPSTIQIKGEDFEVSRIPEARVTASPDLSITVEAQSIRIEGDLVVPIAKLQPIDVSSAARVSRDVVIIDDEIPPVEEEWLASVRVNLILGERVTFFGYGFEGRLDGRLLIEDVPGKASTGTGVITIHDGRYRAYGQRLQVDDGRLLFSGGSLDNPGLDLRAIRQVNDVTVGLLVRGRLQQPQVELFSIPAMDQADTLSYLVLGRPMDAANSTESNTMAKAAMALGLAGGDSYARQLGDQLGLDEVRVENSDDGEQTSLVIGRYLSPDLYVSYGVGLVDSLNSLRLRYRLAERWHVQAETGEYQGADLLFTIER